MSRRIIFSVIGAGAMLVGTASDASAFEMLGRMLGGGCCGPEPACGCAAEPACGCAHAPSRCGHGGGLFGGLFHGHHRNRGCCEPACGFAAEPACGIPMEPACGCAPSCGDPCGRRHHGLFGGLFHGHRRHRGCEPACGCAAEPACGIPVGPTCGCAG